MSKAVTIHFHAKGNPGNAVCGKKSKTLRLNKAWKRVTCKLCLRARPQKKPPIPKTKYTDKFLSVITTLAAGGHIPSYIAKALGVSESTFRAWCKVKPQVQEAFTQGRASADTKIERALFERALGYEHTETKVFSYKGQIVKENVVKHYPPSEAAMSFWLTNREPTKWKTRIEQVNKNMEVDGVDIEIIE